MRETQERYPSPLKSMVFETLKKFQKLGSAVKILFPHAKHRGVCLGVFYMGDEWSMWEADCHDQFANWSRNDRALQEVQYKSGRATARVAPTEVQHEVPWAGDRKGRPYGSVQGMR